MLIMFCCASFLLFAVIVSFLEIFVLSSGCV